MYSIEKKKKTRELDSIGKLSILSDFAVSCTPRSFFKKSNISVKSKTELEKSLTYLSGEHMGSKSAKKLKVKIS